MWGYRKLGPASQNNVAEFRRGCHAASSIVTDCGAREEADRKLLPADVSQRVEPETMLAIMVYPKEKNGAGV
jgi:hypothetical protein